MSEQLCPHGLLMPPPAWPNAAFTRFCRVCFLAQQSRSPVQVVRSTACIHLGPVLSRLSCDCPGRWVRACAVHKLCSLNVCKTCADYEADE